MKFGLTKGILVLTAILGAFAPVFFGIHVLGGIEEYKGVPPKGMTDSLYYYARIAEVDDGYPFVGNPYIIEHKEALSPAFFLPDVLSALPLLVGMPFTATIVLNVLIWSLVFLVLCYKLLRVLALEPKFALIWTLVVYVSSYSFLLRPTVMQLIFPLFLGFMLLLLLYLRDSSDKRSLHLALISALTFYAYTYLSFIVFLTLAFVFVWYLISRNWKQLKTLTLTGVYTAILLIPYALYSSIRGESGLYIETLERIGLVYTRVPALEAFFFGRWIVLALLALALIWYFFPETAKEKAKEKYLFFLATGGALFASLFLNVVTNYELTLAVHIGRFVILWMVLALGVALYDLYVSRRNRKNKWSLYSSVFIAGLILLLVLGTVRNLPRAFSYFSYNDRGLSSLELQQYAAPLNWLEENVEKESVIWTNTSIGTYVPILTKHYVLFHHLATLQMVSGEELLERYLLQNSLLEITDEKLKQDFGSYAGVGALKDTPRVRNREVYVCELIRKIQSDKVCDERMNAYEIRGQAYFDDVLEQSLAVKNTSSDLLEKYNVSYVLLDLEGESIGEFDTSNALYDDGRFVILEQF